MPKYISITPTFNPVSLDEYLQVPTMVYTEQQKEIGKLEDYKDRLSYYKALLGNDERAKDLFNSYNDVINQMTDNLGNYTVGDLQFLGRRARNIFRDTTSRLDVAAQRMVEQQKRKDKDATNVGSVGTIMDYYENPDYSPTFISGKEVSARVGNIAKALAQSLPFNVEGYVDPAKSKMNISQGYTNDELNAAYLEATNPNITPTSNLGKALRQELSGINYFGLDSATQRELGSSILTGLQGGARQYSIMANPNYQAPQTTAQYYQGLNAKLTYEANKKAYEETGYVKPPKESQGWTHVDGEAGKVGEVQNKIYASGAKWTRVKQSDGSWKESYSPAPTTTTSSSTTLKPSGKSIFDAGALISDSSTPLTDSEVTQLRNDVETGSVEVISFGELSNRQQKAVLKAYPKIKTDSDKYTIVLDSRKNLRVLYTPNGTGIPEETEPDVSISGFEGVNLNIN